MTFSFDFTPDKLAACIPNPKIGDWYDVLVKNLPDYQITTPNRVAQWLAQIAHESGDFRLLTENLNYGAKGLRATFPKYFPTDQLANSYARQPERIANRVYGGRMGNGPEASGEGWRFRGRGLIQITGKSNYTACSQALYGDLVLLDYPEILTEPDGAVRSACWYWTYRKINDPADTADTVECTRRINGGTNGLDDRLARYNRYRRILK